MRKGSSSKPTTSHVDLVSDDEKKENEEMNEASDEETISEKGNISEKSDKVEETGETLREMAKTARKIYQRRKKIAAKALPLPVEKSASPSLENEEVETEEIVKDKRCSCSWLGSGQTCFL